MRGQFDFARIVRNRNRVGVQRAMRIVGTELQRERLALGQIEEFTVLLQHVPLLGVIQPPLKGTQVVLIEHGFGFWRHIA